jgi:hypothetical protein
MKQATSRSAGVLLLLIVCCAAAAGFGQRAQRSQGATQNRPAQAAAQQWEYMLVVGPVATDAQHQQTMTNSLNEYGKAGWELTTVTVTPSMVTNYIFKRPKR